MKILLSTYLYLILLLLIEGIYPQSAFSIGLSVTWGEIRVDNLKIGGTYNIKEIAKLPFQVFYRGEKPVEIKIEPRTATKNELKPGYEPLPDISWLKITNDRFLLGPNESGYTDVIITIPNDKQYLGKKFQAYLETHTIGAAGKYIGLALDSRILISISSSEETIQEFDKRRKGLLSGNLSFKVMPDKIIIDKVPVGKKVSLRKYSGVSLKILNPSDEKIVLMLKSLSETEALVSGEKGYEFTPDNSFLIINKNKITVKPNVIKNVDLYLKFPDKIEYKNKKYLFVIKIEPEKQEISLSYYVKIYVSTE